MSVQTVLESGGRCLLAAQGPRGPVLAPVAYWFDGASVWASAAAAGVTAAALEREPVCALWLGTDTVVTVVRGRARVFSLRDPVGLAIHGPTIAAAMAALAASNAGSILSSVQDAVRSPARLLPGNRVAVRVTVVDTEEVRPPAPPPGIAPALPTVVPPDVRRALAGRREIVVATSDGGALDVVPAAWSAGFALALPDRVHLRSGVRAVAAIDDDDVGLALAGTITAGPALRPERATWWHGNVAESADLPPPAATAITLPD